MSREVTLEFEQDDSALDAIEAKLGGMIGHVAHASWNMDGPYDTLELSLDLKFRPKSAPCPHGLVMMSPGAPLSGGPPMRRELQCEGRGEQHVDAVKYHVNTIHGGGGYEWYTAAGIEHRVRVSSRSSAWIAVQGYLTENGRPRELVVAFDKEREWARA